jgi:AraC-like DNA-binding protein
MSEPRYEHVALAQESCRVQTIEIPSLPFVWHYHPQYELILMREGTGRRFVGDSVEHYTPPDLVLLGPDIPHSWVSDSSLGDGQQGATIVQFASDFLGAEFFARPELAAIAGLLNRSSGGLSFPLDASDPLLGWIAELGQRAGFSRLLELLAVLHDLSEREDAVALARPGWGHPSTGGKRLEAALQLMHARYTEPLRLAEVAEAASLTPSAFSRFFRASIGRTFSDYLNDLRIGAAQRLLASTDLPIAAVAARAGFTSLANFNRRFKERTGCSPRVSRQRSLNGDRLSAIRTAM